MSKDRILEVAAVAVAAVVPALCVAFPTAAPIIGAVGVVVGKVLGVFHSSPAPSAPPPTVH